MESIVGDLHVTTKGQAGQCGQFLAYLLPVYIHMDFRLAASFNVT